MPELVHKGKKGFSSSKKKSITVKKLELLKTELDSLSEVGFTGYLKINFSQGSIGRVEKFQEILKYAKSND